MIGFRQLLRPHRTQIAGRGILDLRFRSSRATCSRTSFHVTRNPSRSIRFWVSSSICRCRLENCVMPGRNALDSKLGPVLTISYPRPRDPAPFMGIVVHWRIFAPEHPGGIHAFQRFSTGSKVAFEHTHMGMHQWVEFTAGIVPKAAPTILPVNRSSFWPAFRTRVPAKLSSSDIASLTLDCAIPKCGYHVIKATTDTDFAG